MHCDSRFIRGMPRATLEGMQTLTEKLDDATKSNPLYVAMPAFGPLMMAVTREATAEEIAAYEAQPLRCTGYPKSMIRVGDFHIDTHPGPWTAEDAANDAAIAAWG